MDPVTIFMLTTTVAGLSKGLITLIHDARHNDKMLEGLEHDLVSFKTVINHVEETLTAEDIHRMIGEGDSTVFVAVNDTFNECLFFVNELCRSVEKSRSKRTSIVRLVNTKYRSNDRTALQQRIVNSTRSVQVALQVITLQATLKISDRLEKSSSGIAGSIKSLETQLSSLRAEMSSNNNNNNSSSSPSSSTSAVATIPTFPRSIEALEIAARDTISQAMVVWQEQRRPRPGSVHTVQTERNRDDSMLNQSGVVVTSDKSQRSPQSSTAIGRPTRRPVAGQSLDQPALIAVCGMTGSGKSNFISKLAGRDVGIGKGLRSQTDTVNEIEILFEGRRIILVDTPGFADTTISDTDVLKMIAEFMESSYEQGVLLSGIIYLHQITQNRVAGPSLRNINMFQKLCGENGLKNVILATTMWDTARTKEDIDEFTKREQELTRDFWNRMIARGSQVRQYWNNRQTGEDLIRELLGRTPVALEIQSELVDEHKNLVDTAAGSYIDEGLEKLHQQYQEELDEYFKMMQTSTEQARYEAEQEYKAILEKMQINEEETRLLHEQRLNEMGQQRDEQARARADDARAYDKKFKDLQKSFEAELRESAKQAERQIKAHKKDIENMNVQRTKEQNDLMKRHKLDMDQLHRASEARSAREKADLVQQLEIQLNRQLSENEASADAKMSSLEAELQRLSFANSSRENEINRLHAAAQDSNNNNAFNSGNTRNSRFNNNNTVNSGNTNSRTYHNHLGRSDSGSDEFGGGGAIPPPPPPPKLLRVPPPAKHFLGRGEAEKRENQRRQRVHEQQLDAYYRKYG